MVRKVLILLTVILGFGTLLEAQDSVIYIPEVVISSNIKLYGNNDSLTLMSDKFNANYLNNHNVNNFKDFSSQSPSLYIPDYGSRITSSIYLRGLGSRIDNSSVSVSLDGVMLLNKNCFDFSYFDLAGVQVLKGAQSLLFGMNTSSGLISLTTLSPFDFNGIKASLGAGNKENYNLSFSLYEKKNDKLAYMFGFNAMNFGGFFSNEYAQAKNDKVDWIKEGNLRFIAEYRPNVNLKIKNSSFVSLIHQGGYAYAKVDTVTFKSGNINYDSPSSYDRLNIINNTLVSYKKRNAYRFLSLSSLQLNFDKMNLDNDFTPLPYFTLEQKEKDYACSQEFILKNNKEDSDWDWTSGVFAFYKYLDMKAPVVFKSMGIDKLILDNINKGMHSSGVFPDDFKMSFLQDEMPVSDDFKYPRSGGALYGEIAYSLNKIRFSFGLRADIERVSLDYDSRTSVDYIISGFWTESKHLNTVIKGKDSETYTEILPKFSVLFDTKHGNIFLALSKGYMTGGFNTQMFADIVQNQMKQDMLSALGLTPEGIPAMQDIYSDYKQEDIIYYKPQFIWNYEAGGHFSFLDKRLLLNMSVYYMDIHSQQLTIFLSPMTTGRMMTNAAKSYSLGGEFSSIIRLDNLNIHLAYAYTKAKFLEYNDNKQDYKGNFLTYYPLNTLSVTVD